MAKQDITPELINKVSELIQEGWQPSKIKTIISEETGFRKTKSNDIYNSILKTQNLQSDIFDFDITSEDEADEPYFNKESGKYIVFLKSLGRNIVVSESRHKRILEAYSDWDNDPKTLNEICRAIQWPRPVLTEYLKKFHIDHGCLPISDEDLGKHDDQELISRLKELRKFSLYQKFEKESWDSVRADAQKWRSFQYKQLDPIKEMLEAWTPPHCKRGLKLRPKGKNTLIATLSDLHFGAFSKPNLTFRKNNLSSKIIANRVVELSERTVQDALEQNVSDIAVLMMGDILNSCNIAGTTNRGTLIEGDLTGGELFKFALDTLVVYFNNLLTLNKKINVFGVVGNHDAALSSGLMYALSAFYRTIPDKINFQISEKFIEHYTIRNSIFCISHGSHWSVKAKIPKGPKVIQYAQSLFLEAQKSNPNCNSRYLITADLHHQCQLQEANDFHYILLPSITGGCNFSDTLNLHSRACQQAFLLDDMGIKTTNNYYFDE